MVLWAGGLLFAVVAALSSATQAQVLMTITNASIFEGNSGTSILKLPVNFAVPPGSTTNPTTVTGFANAFSPPAGAAIHPATGGSSCSAGVDFIQFTNSPFSIPPNTPNGTLSVNITICSDAVIEQDEQILVTLTNVAGGAFCFSDTPVACVGIGTIVNDDGPPSMSINDIVVSEPSGTSATRTAFFTVSLHHLTAQTVTAHFATSACPLICEFVPTSGTLTIPPNTLSGTIPVTIRNDNFIGSNQSLTMTLSSPTNATIFDGTGFATIVEAPLFSPFNPPIGAFDLSPDEATVENGVVVDYELVWTVPDGQTWHDLKSIDFRIGAPGNPVLWVRWDEASNTFSLCGLDGGDAAHDRAAQHGEPPVVCGAALAPGSAAPLVTPSAQLLLADTTVVGSGPTGPSVALHLAVAFGPKINTRQYPIELSVANDFGGVAKFFHATDVTVE